MWLCVLVPVLALLWIGWRGVSRDSRVYSSGRMSGAHAVLEKQCAVCHLQKAGEFSSKAADAACLACHDGPAHHDYRIAAPGCATCHAEHRGRIDIVAVSDQICAECHANLKTQTGVSAAGPTFRETQIRSFEDGHPEFAAVQPEPGYVARDPGTPKVNHAIHLKPIRRGPNGPEVQLECRDCHRLQADAAVVYSNNADPRVPPSNWMYADMQYLRAKPSYGEQRAILPVPVRALPSYRPLTGREFMERVSFAKACSGCHSLAFDKRFYEGVPHDKPEVVHEFLVKRFEEYIASHPGDVRVVREPKRDLTGKPIPPDVRVLTAEQWVAEQTSQAEELLWRKTCKQCHQLRVLSPGANLPVVQPVYGVLPWMLRSKFEHDAHRGFTCMSCHAKALSSTEATDILLPGIATCRTCHAPGPEHAESRCFECHTYHDWSKRKEVKPAFTLPALQTGGR